MAKVKKEGFFLIAGGAIYKHGEFRVRVDHHMLWGYDSVLSFILGLHTFRF